MSVLGKGWKVTSALLGMEQMGLLVFWGVGSPSVAVREGSQEEDQSGFGGFDADSKTHPNTAAPGVLRPSLNLPAA